MILQASILAVWVVGILEILKPFWHLGFGFGCKSLGSWVLECFSDLGPGSVWGYV